MLIPEPDLPEHAHRSMVNRSLTGASSVAIGAPAFVNRLVTTSSAEWACLSRGQKLKRLQFFRFVYCPSVTRVPAWVPCLLTVSLEKCQR